MKKNSSANRSTPNKPAPEPNTPPATDSKAHFSSKDPGKIDELVKAAHLEIPEQKVSATAASTSNRPHSAPPSQAQTKTDGNDTKRRVSFQFKRPAGSVKVVGDFTHWDQAPVDMVAAGEGQWSAVVQLPPGEYAYRFIVDGQWCDDPSCSRHVPNGFGSENSVLVVR